MEPKFQLPENTRNNLKRVVKDAWVEFNHFKTEFELDIDEVIPIGCDNFVYVKMGDNFDIIDAKTQEVIAPDAVLENRIIELSPNNKYLMAFRPRATLIIDTQSRKLHSKIVAPDLDNADVWMAANFSPDSQYLILYSNKGSCHIYDIQSRQTQIIKVATEYITNKSGFCGSLYVNSNLDKISVKEEKYSVSLIIDLKSGQKLSPTDCLDTNEEDLRIEERSGEILFLDHFTSKEVYRVQSSHPDEKVDWIKKLSPDYLLTVGEKGSLTVWNYKERKSLTGFKIPKAKLYKAILEDNKVTVVKYAEELIEPNLNKIKAFFSQKEV